MEARNKLGLSRGVNKVRGSDVTAIACFHVKETSEINSGKQKQNTLERKSIVDLGHGI